MVPFDSRSAFQTSGIRLGTPAITTRGAKEDLMIEIAEMIETVLSNVDNEEVIAQVRARVNETMKKYPILLIKNRKHLHLPSKKWGLCLNIEIDRLVLTHPIS